MYVGIINKWTINNKKKEEDVAWEYVRALKTKTPTVETEVVNLSGGNQQKVVFAKLLTCDLKLLILDEPTKGIDVGAKYSIYEIMNELAEKGYAIIMVSSEMPEVLGMADRIIVMRNGRVAGEYDAKEATQEILLSAALKSKEDK